MLDLLVAAHDWKWTTLSTIKAGIAAAETAQVAKWVTDRAREEKRFLVRLPGEDMLPALLLAEGESWETRRFTVAEAGIGGGGGGDGSTSYGAGDAEGGIGSGRSGHTGRRIEEDGGLDDDLPFMRFTDVIVPGVILECSGNKSLILSGSSSDYRGGNGGNDGDSENQKEGEDGDQGSSLAANRSSRQRGQGGQFSAPTTRVPLRPSPASPPRTSTGGDGKTKDDGEDEDNSEDEDDNGGSSDRSKKKTGKNKKKKGKNKTKTTRTMTTKKANVRRTVWKPQYQVHLQGVDGSRETIAVRMDDTVLDMKRRIFGVENKPFQVALVHNGKRLRTSRGLLVPWCL